MKHWMALALIVGAAACTDPVADTGAELDRVSEAMALPVDDAPMSDRDRVIAGIEAAGCIVIADNADEVFASIGLPEADIRRIGAELVADGLADVSRVGIYRLETAPCAI